jgi:hypothetical protein
MKTTKTALVLIASAFLLFIGGFGLNASAEEKAGAEVAVNLSEMPLLTGYTWQKMSQDEKVAFVWGLGHVATMERESAEQNLDLKRTGFAMKLSAGIAGVSMNRIVADVDNYFSENSAKATDPVIKVIWDSYVSSGLRSDGANLPSK